MALDVLDRVSKTASARTSWFRPVLGDVLAELGPPLGNMGAPADPSIGGVCVASWVSFGVGGIVCHIVRSDQA
jgi:hypothetical protein